MSNGDEPNPVAPIRRKVTALLPRLVEKKSPAELLALRHRRRAKVFLIRGFVVFLMALLPTGSFVQIPLYVLAGTFEAIALYEYQRYRISLTLSTLQRDPPLKQNY